jgi:Kef-type K+ transport system membrane component KefB
LESNLAGLLTQLKRASYVWLAGVAISAAVGYLAAAFMGLALIPRLFVAIALTATSVGVSVGVWHEAGALESSTGELLVDVAEMGDISGIIFMALLFAIAPVLQSGLSSGLLTWFSRPGEAG